MVDCLKKKKKIGLQTKLCIYYSHLRNPVSTSFNTIPPASTSSMKKTASPRRITSCLVVKTMPTVIFVPASVIPPPSLSPSTSVFAYVWPSSACWDSCGTSVQGQDKGQYYQSTGKVHFVHFSYTTDRKYLLCSPYFP